MTRLNILPENPEPEALGRFPSWLHRKLPQGMTLAKTRSSIESKRLHTVCEEARCPNLTECWSRSTATFLVMGKACTRNCGFCDIDFTKNAPPLDPEEPERVAESVAELQLKHVVITHVARDDLPDGGADHLVQVIFAIRERCAGVTIEVLSSDLQGNLSALDHLLSAAPTIFNHNIETVRSLTPRVRHKATYDRTLSVLSHASGKVSFVKSGLMVGLGETEEEVFATLHDLKQAGCSMVTIGQYLQPNRHKLLVKAFIHPDQFQRYADFGRSIGISSVFAGPFVRSSYHAGEIFEKEKRT